MDSQRVQQLAASQHPQSSNGDLRCSWLFYLLFLSYWLAIPSKRSLKPIFPFPLSQTDLDNGLRFCVQAGKVKSVHEKSGSPLKEESKEELVNILLKIAATHFVSDAPEPVLLANQVPYSNYSSYDPLLWSSHLIDQVLREELADRLPKLGLKSPETEVDSEHLSSKFCKKTLIPTWILH